MTLYTYFRHINLRYPAITRLNIRSIVRRRCSFRSVALTLLALSLLPSASFGATSGIDANESPKASASDKAITITLAVRVGAPAYYFEGKQTLGIDSDIADLLRHRAGISLKVVTVKTAAEALRVVRQGAAQLAAGYLAVQPTAYEGLRALPVYANIRHQMAYYYGERAPANLFEVPCERLEVSAHPAHFFALREVAANSPDKDAPCAASASTPTSASSLASLRRSNIDAREMLRLLDQGFVNYALVDSSDVIIYRHRYPRLKIAFTLPEPVPVVWLANKELPPVLFEKLTDFFDAINADETAQRLRERYFQHTAPLEYGAKLTFIQRANSVLKEYLPDFIRTANLLGMDWRLLAALSYKESLWNAKAISPTHAKGLMMLTIPIARQYGVENRFDAAKNIMAGARYFISLRNRLPPTIEEPDRTWFALAAYNIGMRYVLNARALAIRAGKNPDWWMHVNKFFSAARKDSDAPVRLQTQKYVYLILHYLDLIRWLDQELLLSAEFIE